MLVLVAMVMFNGCAPYLKNGYWVKPEASYEQFSKDYVECRREAMRSSAVFPKLQKDLANCMKDRGYEWEVHAGGSLITNSTLFYTKGGYNSQQKAPQLKAVESLPPETAKPEKPITSTPTIPPSGTATVVTVIWTSADIRSGAGNEFPIVMTVDKGDKLTVIGERGEWFNVRLEDGKEGWINSEAVKSQEYAPEKPITSAPTTFSSGTRKILTWDFSVAKSGPGNDYPVIATFRKGDKLTILEQSGEWVRVRSDNNQEGWISSEVLE